MRGRRSMPEIRADMVAVFVCRFAGAAAGDDAIELLQLRRAREPARGTWQPVMGAIEEGETAVQAALRELDEETGLKQAGMLGMWALDQASPFYVHTRDVIILAPRFCALVGEAWQAALNDEHDAYRWVRMEDAGRVFVWPTQMASVREITAGLLHGESVAAGISRVV
jgi:8-oxo-dGTP pyrophosphatase MutT (NUDIX family)